MNHRDRSLLCLVWGLVFAFDALSSCQIQTNPEWMGLNPLVRSIIGATSSQITFLVMASVAIVASTAVVRQLPKQLLWVALLVILADFLNGQICWYRYVADVIQGGVSPVVIPETPATIGLLTFVGRRVNHLE